MSGGPKSGGDGGFAKGRRIDRYEIREPIGQGGMGAVYRAFDTKLGRMVALKTVVAHRRAAMNDELRQRFMREAMAASKVDHRNVVQVLDFGFTDDGSPFIVMEYLRGKDLGARLKQSPEPLAVEYVADVMLGVCAALRACHLAGIIHRDLKPANIFLVDTDTGYEVKVLDFGVSKAALTDDLTEEGQILGTPQYLSPEQVEGKTVPESDQYALGMLLYACLTKRLPYEEHQNLSLLRAIELGKFQPPRAHRPDLPAALEAIILQALNVSPSERFESVHALGQRLWEFASPHGREQWKNYYFQTPPAAWSAKFSTQGIPVVEALARGTLKGPPVLVKTRAPTPADAPGNTERIGSAADTARGDSAVTPLGGEPSATGEPGGAAPAGPQALVSTKLAQAPATVGGAAGEGSLLDVAGESAIEEPHRAGRGRAARRAFVGVLAGAGLLGGALFVYSGLGRERSPVKPGASATPPGAIAVPPAPGLPASPKPGAAVQIPTATALHRAPATEASTTATGARAPSADAPTTGAAAPSDVSTPRRAPATPKRRHRGGSKVPLDYTPDGVPIMP